MFMGGEYQMKVKMSIQKTIHDLSSGLYKSGIIDQKKYKKLISNHDVNEPDLIIYSPNEIKEIRKRENVSQSVFAKYLNVSLPTIRSLEQGKRQAKGAILKLINLVDKNGLSELG